MTIRPLLSSENVHATTIAIGGRGILLTGRSGAGKSDLALRLIDRGAALVSDDYTLVKREGERLVASAPATIAGKMEVRGLGIVDVAACASAPVALLIDLDSPVERMPPDEAEQMILGITLPALKLDPRPPSAPIQVELALRLRGLP